MTTSKSAAKREIKSQEQGSLVQDLTTPTKRKSGRGDNSVPSPALSHRFREPDSPASSIGTQASQESSIAVVLPTVAQKKAQEPPEKVNIVKHVVEEVLTRNHGLRYLIEYKSGEKDQVSFTLFTFLSCDVFRFP